MNNVQTNLMNVAAAPSIKTKANAAEAVRPTGQTTAAGERGAKKPPFNQALAKAASARGKADASEAMEAQSENLLAASLAASQQAQEDKADAAKLPTPETAQEAMLPTDNDAAAETLPVTSNLALQVPAEEMAAPPQTAGMVKSTAGPEKEITELAAPKADVLMGAEKAANVENLATLMSRDEKTGTTDLLQALSVRNRMQAVQPTAMEGTPESEAMPQTDSGEKPILLQSETSLASQMSLTTEQGDDSVLPDELLRTLAQQPTTANAAATAGQQQSQPSVQNAGTAVSITETLTDARILPVQPSETAHDKNMTDDSANDGFADLFAQQQTKQEEKSGPALLMTQPSSEEGVGRVKVTIAAQPSAEMVQQPQQAGETQPAQHASLTSFQTTLQETSSMQQPTTSQPPPRDYEVARQIVEQARLLRLPGETEMVIRLKPEHLGELTLKVSVAASGAVNAAFHTDNAAVRAIIETSMIQLKQELQAQGLKVDNVGVYAGLGDSSMMNGQQDPNAYYAQQGGQGSSQGRDVQQALAAFEEEKEALAADSGHGVIAQDGVDYRV